MNEFTICVDRDISIPLSVTTLDRMKEIMIVTDDAKYKICWSTMNTLVFVNMKTKAVSIPEDKDGNYLKRELAPGCPITYKKERK